MSEVRKNNDELSRRQEAALIALMEGATLSLSQIAAKISVNPRTINRWMKDEAFLRRYRALRTAQVERGVARLQDLFDKAVDTLEKNLDSGNRPSEVRSAVSIINQSMAGVDLLDHDQRILAIERRFESPKVKK
jgi:transcriptional regulator with XRE-family HTH domain